VRIDPIDQQKIDVAMTALNRAGVTGDIAKCIAYESVADSLENSADNHNGHVKHTDGSAYRRELNYIDELRQRSKHLRNQVQFIKIDPASINPITGQR
jgi:hypothetical protein